MRLAALLLVVIGATAFADTPRKFDRKAWTADYTFLKSELERSYGHLAWLASPQSGVDLRALDRRCTRALAAAESDADAELALQNFIAGFHDGHMRFQGRLQPGAAPAPNPPPINLDEVDASTGVASLGYAPFTSVAFSLPFESLKGTQLINDGIAQPFRTGVVTTENGTRLGLLRIPRFREVDSAPAFAERVWKERKQAGKPMEVAAIKDAISDAWYAALANQLRELEKQHVAAVIVDVGGNGGGNDAGDWTTRVFTSKDIHSQRLMMQTAAAGRYFDKHLEELRKAAAERPSSSSLVQPGITAIEQRKARLESRKTSMTWVWREQRPWSLDGPNQLIEAGFFSGEVDSFPVSAPEDRAWVSSFFWAARVDGFRGAWSGPVYIVTDGGTGSAAENFVATMRDNNIAKTAGAKTLGAGCGFMVDDAPVQLPHSRMRIQVPNCVRLRADNTDEVAGIQPDLPVLATEGENGRARAVRLLESVARDLVVPTH